jgi:hypothetical protein
VHKELLVQLEAQEPLDLPDQPVQPVQLEVQEQRDLLGQQELQDLQEFLK